MSSLQCSVTNQSFVFFRPSHSAQVGTSIPSKLTNMVKSNARTMKLVLFSEYYWPFRCPQKPSKNTIKRQNSQSSNRSYVTLGGKTLISVLPTLSGMTHRDRKQFDYIRVGGTLWDRCQPTNGCRGTFFQSLRLWVFLTTWISTTEGRCWAIDGKTGLGNGGQPERVVRSCRLLLNFVFSG